MADGHTNMADGHTIRVALTEDNPVSKNSFLEKAGRIPEWTVVSMSRTGTEFMEMLRTTRGEALPQVVFMDLEMPGLDGCQTIAMAKSIYPDILFIALTVFDDDEKIFDAIRSGACGYLLKHESYLVLREAVTNALDYGGAPMSPAIARKALQLLSQASRPVADDTPVRIPAVISDREKEVLEYTVHGWDAKRIADVLNISVHTVRKHIANIYEKLQVRSKAEIIQIAHRNKWYKP